MRSTWRDGLVDAFPTPRESKLKSASLPASKTESRGERCSLTPSTGEKTTFPFFDLPSELRNEVYSLVLLSEPKKEDNSRKLSVSRLQILLTDKRFHTEASHVLYRSHAFRVFPIQDFTPLKSIREIPIRYRSLVTNLEMIIGSSWTSPPKTWRVNKSLAKCLAKMTSVSTLKIFVELDPSHPIFAKYRISFDFYTNFCGNLLRDVLVATPQISFVILDGNPGVNVHGELVTRLRKEAETQGKIIQWGKRSDWNVKKQNVPSIQFG